MESREQTVVKLIPEKARLQYDGNDHLRIHTVAEDITQAFIPLLHTAAAFRDEIQKEVTEDSASEMKQVRLELVEAYARALVELHKLGAVFRISEEAFDRMVEHLSGPEEVPLVLSDL